MKIKAYYLGIFTDVLGIDFKNNKVKINDAISKDVYTEMEISLDSVTILYNVGIDKNNSEIYSGDIVECFIDTDENGTPKYKVYQVIWNETYNCWWLSDLFGTEDEYFHRFNSNEMEIVDNIFQQHRYYNKDGKFYKWSF